jgi:transcriptional antiterminator NusG
MADDARWYAIHTYAGYENKVADSIRKIVENRSMQESILDVSIPTEIVTEIREDQSTREVERKLFPGYVLVKLAVNYDEDDQPKMSDETWYVIRNTRGVTGFVGPESKPVPLREEEVLKLGVEKRSIEVSYEVGDTVNIMDGIMDGFSGVVQEIDLENNMVKVTVSAFFGRETLVELELDQVEPVTD